MLRSVNSRTKNPATNGRRNAYETIDSDRNNNSAAEASGRAGDRLHALFTRSKMVETETNTKAAPHCTTEGVGDGRHGRNVKRRLYLGDRDVKS